MPVIFLNTDTNVECDLKPTLSPMPLNGVIGIYALTRETRTGFANAVFVYITAEALPELIVDDLRYISAVTANVLSQYVERKIRGSGVIPWQSYPKMIDKRYMKNGRSDTPCS